MKDIKINFNVSKQQLLLATEILKKTTLTFEPENISQIVQVCFERYINQNLDMYDINITENILLNNLLKPKPKPITTLDEFIKQQNINI